MAPSGFSAPCGIVSDNGMPNGSVVGSAASTRFGSPEVTSAAQGTSCELVAASATSAKLARDGDGTTVTEVLCVDSAARLSHRMLPDVTGTDAVVCSSRDTDPQEGSETQAVFPPLAAAAD